MSGRLCCVLRCTSCKRRNPELDFYRFPCKPYEEERRQSWIKAVRNRGKNGRDWEPIKKSHVCSLHFVSGKKSNNQADVDYVPTIFPPYKKDRKQSKLQASEPLLQPSSKPIPDHVQPVMSGMGPQLMKDGLSGASMLTEKLLQCEECDVRFSDDRELRIHRLKAHGLGTWGDFKCLEFDCRQGFSNVTQLQKHLQRAHGKHLDKRKLTFPSILGFAAWRKKFENDYDIEFVEYKVGKKTRSEDDGPEVDARYFRCDGKSEPISTNCTEKRPITKRKNFCTATIELRCSRNGTCAANVCFTHYGHEALSDKPVHMELPVNPADYALGEDFFPESDRDAHLPSTAPPLNQPEEAIQTVVVKQEEEESPSARRFMPADFYEQLPDWTKNFMSLMPQILEDIAADKPTGLRDIVAEEIIKPLLTAINNTKSCLQVKIEPPSSNEGTSLSSSSVQFLVGSSAFAMHAYL